MAEKIISRVQKRRNKKFNELLDHAMKLIVQKGFSELKMRSLADSLDITPGALYRYFPSKAHIIGALGNRILKQYTISLQKAVESTHLSFQDYSAKERSLFSIGELAKEYFTISTQSSEQYRILSMIMTDETRYMTNPDDYSLFMNGSIELLRYVASQYDVAAQQGSIKQGDAFERALILFTLLQGSLQLQKFGQERPNTINPISIFSSGLSNHLLGLGAKKEHVDMVIKYLYMKGSSYIK